MRCVIGLIVALLLLSTAVSAQAPPASGPRPMTPGPCIGYANPIPVYVFTDVRRFTDQRQASFLVLTNPSREWAMAYFDTLPYPEMWVAPGQRLVVQLSNLLPWIGQHSVIVATYQVLLSVQVMTWHTDAQGNVSDVVSSPRDVYCQ